MTDIGPIRLGRVVGGKKCMVINESDAPVNVQPLFVWRGAARRLGPPARLEHGASADFPVGSFVWAERPAVQCLNGRKYRFTRDASGAPLLGE